MKVCVVKTNGLTPYLSYNIRWFKMSNGPNVLFHGTIVIAFTTKLQDQNCWVNKHEFEKTLEINLSTMELYSNLKWKLSPFCASVLFIDGSAHNKFTQHLLQKYKANKTKIEQKTARKFSGFFVVLGFLERVRGYYTIL